MVGKHNGERGNPLQVMSMWKETQREGGTCLVASAWKETQRRRGCICVEANTTEKGENPSRCVQLQRKHDGRGFSPPIASVWKKSGWERETPLLSCLCGRKHSERENTMGEVFPPSRCVPSPKSAERASLGCIRTYIDLPTQNRTHGDVFTPPPGSCNRKLTKARERAGRFGRSFGRRKGFIWVY